MPRVSIIPYENLTEEQKTLYDWQISQHGRITNMKKTLLHSPLSLKIYMEWYDLRTELAKAIGDFGTYIFSYSLSASNDCIICSTFFRKILKDNGRNPDALVLTREEQFLWDFGRAIAKDAHRISEELYTYLNDNYTEEVRVLLTAFAGQMLATNLINTVLQVPLDEYLQNYTAITIK